MEVINPSSALLSNFEVLSLLRELESDHLARSKTAIRIKKEEEASGGTYTAPPVEISENLRTIEVEAIQYLSAEYQPTSSQTPEGITQLVKDLGKYTLTKAEKLQVVNLAPTQPVELYVIVEELEDRLGEVMEDILSEIKTSLAPTSTSNGVGSSSHANYKTSAGADSWDLGCPDADADFVEAPVDDMVFDDTGEGAGVEGDLDMDDD